jgi:hypothetical protein
MKFVSCLTKGFAFLLVTLLVLSIPLTLVTFNLQRQLLRPEPYIKVFAERGLYEQIPGILAIQLVESMAQADLEAEEGPPPYFRSLDQAQWMTLLQTVMPPEWAQQQIEGVINGVFAFLNGQTETVEAAISLKEMKAALNGPEGQAILRTMILSMPPCPPSEVEAAVKGMLNEESPTLPVCAPPAALVDQEMGEIHAELIAATAQIPAEVPIELSREDFAITDPERPDEEGNLLEGYRLVRLILRLGPVVVMFMFLLLAVLVVRSVQELLVWWGWPLFLGGAAVLLPVLSAGKELVQELGLLVRARAPEPFSPRIVDTLADIIEEIATSTLTVIGVEAVLLVSAGFVMIVLAYILSRREDDESQLAG